MTPSRDPRFEAMLVKLMAFCKANNVTAHTTKNGPALVFKEKKPKRSAALEQLAKLDSDLI